MSRIVSVWLPHLPIERLKQERAANGAAPPEQSEPAISFRGPAVRPGRQRGARAHPHGGQRGERPRGLLPAWPRRCPRHLPHLLTAPAAPEKDADTLPRLARWASRYSPTLNVDGDDGLWLDITGVPHLFGGESALLADLATRLARAGFTARLGLAETLGGAHALARFAKASPASFLTEAPRRARNASRRGAAPGAETARLLRRLGLKRIGQLYDLPRASLERRFHAKETAEAVLRVSIRRSGPARKNAKPCCPRPTLWRGSLCRTAYHP